MLNEKLYSEKLDKWIEEERKNHNFHTFFSDTIYTFLENMNQVAISGGLINFIKSESENSVRFGWHSDDNQFNGWVPISTILIKKEEDGIFYYVTAGFSSTPIKVIENPHAFDIIPFRLSSSENIEFMLMTTFSSQLNFLLKKIPSFIKLEMKLKEKSEEIQKREFLHLIDVTNKELKHNIKTNRFILKPKKEA